MKTLLLILMLVIVPFAHQICAQSFTSYFTGSAADSESVPQGGVCMMGGATEHDEAMRWFLRRADGGDVLVLRASGSDGYNNYMYSELGIKVNSVETIVFNHPAASDEEYIHTRIKQAEAIWFAGGDQWNYVSYWRHTPIDSLINDALCNRNIVIGGTSAGMAILSRYYFSAQNGTVTSAQALGNPYDNHVMVDSTQFLNIDFLHDVVTDTHYEDRDREGRHVVFLARILTDYGVAAKGIACNAYTAVCIDENGLACVYGDYPSYPEAAYFLQTNCQLANIKPENCASGSPLDWELGKEAIKVYKVNGTNEGSNYFDLRDWQNGEGGTWENWSVDKGVLTRSQGSPVNCQSTSVDTFCNYVPAKTRLSSVWPNPFNQTTRIAYQLHRSAEVRLTMYDILGRQVAVLAAGYDTAGEHQVVFDGAQLSSGVYIISLRVGSNETYVQKTLLVK